MREREFWYRQIYEGKHGKPGDQAYRATPEELREYERHAEDATLPNRLRETFTPGTGWFWLLMIFAVAAPLALYAVVLGGSAIVRWIARGFAGR